MAAPCKDCKDRFVGDGTNCHSTCEKYLAFKEERESISAARQVEYNKSHKMRLYKGGKLFWHK